MVEYFHFVFTLVFTTVFTTGFHVGFHFQFSLLVFTFSFHFWFSLSVFTLVFTFSFHFWFSLSVFTFGFHLRLTPPVFTASNDAISKTKPLEVDGAKPCFPSSLVGLPNGSLATRGRVSGCRTAVRQPKAKMPPLILPRTSSFLCEQFGQFS